MITCRYIFPDDSISNCNYVIMYFKRIPETYKKKLGPGLRIILEKI